MKSQKSIGSSQAAASNNLLTQFLFKFCNNTSLPYMNGAFKPAGHWSVGWAQNKMKEI